MKHSLMVITLLVIFVFLTFGCSNEMLSYRSLTQSEIEQFTKGENVEPLAIRDIANSFTVILFANETEMGHYSVSVDSKGRTSSDRSISNNNSKVTPVSIGWVSTGIPFATVIINDSEILKKASDIMVRFEDGYEIKEPINNRKGIIVPNESVKNANLDVNKVKIFDKNGQVLFEN